MASSEEISDDTLSQFLAFSGSSDPSVARQYLEMSGNNLERAVSLFMDHAAGGGGAGDMGGGASGAGGGMGGGGDGMGEIRAPDATRSMRLVGGMDPPRGAMPMGMPHGGMGMAMNMGGMGGMGNDPNAALMAAIGGPAAREMMRNMMAAENGLGGPGDNGDGNGMMGSAWAAADSTGAGAATRSFRDASRSGSGSRRARSGSGASGSGAGGNARRNSQRRSPNNNNPDDDDDDDDVQVVDATGQAMDEDSDDEYNYPDSDDDSHDFGGAANTNNARSSRNNNSNAQPPSLQTMFEQPTHLMHRAGGFLGAKNFAKDARRWLLVNIQSDDDFACHALNRDVWRDELVENLVREGFILWQAMSNSNEGRTYITRYKVQGYPHLAIIDPRTGSLLWRKEGWTQVNPLSAEQFVEIASDFCSQHSFDKMPMAARNAYSNGIPLGAAASPNNESSSNRPANSNKRPIHELTEEEQLQAAIRASMQDDAGVDEENDNDDVEVVDGAMVEDEKKPSANDNNATTNDDAGEDESKPSAFEKEILSMEVGDEPTPGGNVARVQIRMPDGKRLVRKFGGDSPVKVIYAFVAQSNDEAKGGRAFELKAKFPPQDLFANVDDGISSCGLNG